MDCRAISPKTVQHTWSKGKMVDVVRDLLPGYVFLYREDQKIDISALHQVSGVIRCLCDTAGQCELWGADEAFAMLLLRKEGVIGKTQVYQVGQRIVLCEGAYEGTQANILKVNHRNMRMQIEVPFANRSIKTWVEYEIVKKLDPETE